MLVNVLRWTARLAGLLVVAVLLLFLFGEGDFSDPTMPTAREIAGILLFPGAVAVGTLLGWKREGLGGAIAAAGLAGFYILHIVFWGDPPRGPWFLIFSAPGILFGAVALLERRRR